MDKETAELLEELESALASDLADVVQELGDTVALAEAELKYGSGT